MKKLVIVELELEIDDTQLSNAGLAEGIQLQLSEDETILSINYCVCRDKFRRHNNDTPPSTHS